jgi:hypothetical protein
MCALFFVVGLVGGFFIGTIRTCERGCIFHDKHYRSLRHVVADTQPEKDLDL